MAVISLIIIGAVACSMIMLGVWFLQRKLNDAGIVDLAWSLCLGGLAIFYAALASGAFLPKTLMLVFALFWSLRLALHLFVRIRDYPEDGRYLYLREYWGDKQQQGMFWFFQAQAGFAIVFSIPLLVVASNPVAKFTVWSLLAIVIYLIAVAGESLADWQLAQFKRQPDSKGKTCRVGLWRYSRHPNYFFEWLHWFAYVFLSIGSGYWWLTVLAGPLLMFAFLYRFTGIPYTEQQAIRSRGDDYRDYQKTTSAFFPWFPKS
ncbi:MAG: DUF1295 domain-containing protein [Gammaproteobacteria bacterium]